MRWAALALAALLAALCGPAGAALTAACASSPPRLLLSNSSASIAETIRGSEACASGWVVTYIAGVYVGPRHCGVAWPSSTDITLMAAGGTVQVDCGGAPVLWTLDYGEAAPRRFALDAEPGADWLLTQAASFVRITVTQSTPLLVRLAHVRFLCLLYPGPAAVVVRSPSGLRALGAAVEISNCSFAYGAGFGVAIMGAANVTSLATSYTALSRGALFCVADAAAPPRAAASLDADAADARLSCLNCALSVAGAERPCEMPTAPAPPVPPDYYTACHVPAPPPPPTPRPPLPPPTSPPAQARLLLLVLLSSFVIGAGLLALLVAAIWRARAGRAAAASLSTDPQAPSPHDFL